MYAHQRQYALAHTKQSSPSGPQRHQQFVQTNWYAYNDTQQYQELPALDWSDLVNCKVAEDPNRRL
jgi:hypothetical protein